MSHCRIYVEGSEPSELMQFLPDNPKLFTGTARKGRIPDSRLSAETASIVIASLSSLTALVTAILTFLNAKNSSGTIKLSLPNGTVAEIPSRLADDEIEKILKTTKELSGLLVTVRVEGEQGPDSTKTGND